MATRREPLESWLADHHGEVGLVFTDVVASTELLFAKKTLDFRARMRRHQKQARILANEHRGVLVEAKADSTFAAFPNADLARGYALALHADPGSGGLSIRAGVHFGPVSADGDALVGRHVYLAARVCERGDGHEVWMSDDARAALSGEHREADDVHEDRELKGIPEPVRIWRIA